MRHVVLTTAFKFDAEPFPAFRANPWPDRNTCDRVFLPVWGIAPVVMYTVTADSGRTELYNGPDRSCAEQIKSEYNEQNAAGKQGRVELKATAPTLPEGKFQIIKTREQGMILVVPGNDTANRCLLFVGCDSGFHGSVEIVQGATTAQIIKKFVVSNSSKLRIDVIAILDVEQRVVFHASGCNIDEVYVYRWSSGEVRSARCSKSEWDQWNAATSASVEDAEVL